MWNQVLTATIDELLVTVFLVAALYAGVVLYVRLAGLRSFSKMSAPDFAMTVAVGSLLAMAADPSRSLPVLLAGGASLFACKWLAAYCRSHWQSTQRVLDNAPLLLMSRGRILQHNLRAGQVATEDLMGKLREANVLNFEQVRAVVLETTGDISVLHSSNPDEVLDPELLRGVQDGERAGDDDG